MIEVRGRIVSAVPLIDVIIRSEDDHGVVPIELPSTALVDTGATASFVGGKTARQLGLSSSGKRLVRFGGDGEAMPKDRFVCEFAFVRTSPDGEPVPWPDLLLATEFDASNRPFDLILGMDVISHGELTLSRGETLSFRFPPPEPTKP